MNTAKEERKITFDKFAERTGGFTKYKDVVTKTESEIKEFTLGSYKTVVLELMK